MILQMVLLTNFLSQCFQGTKLVQKHQRQETIFFDSVQLLHYKCHKINFKGFGSYIVSPDCIKKKKTTTNQKNGDDKCFQYAEIDALKYGEIELLPERVSNIRPFNPDEIKHSSDQMTEKCFRKISQQFFLVFYALKEYSDEN